MTLHGGPQLAVVAFVFSVHLLWCYATATQLPLVAGCAHLAWSCNAMPVSLLDRALLPTLQKGRS